MPVEPIKEAVKVAVETSEGFGSLVHWALGAVGSSVVAVWGHVTGRIKRLEETLVTHTWLEEHISSEEKQFDLLFKKHDALLEKLTTVAVDVATIKGKLSTNHDWQDQK